MLHKKFNKIWTEEEKDELATKVVARASRVEDALKTGISLEMVIGEFKNINFRDIMVW